MERTEEFQGHGTVRLHFISVLPELLSYITYILYLKGKKVYIRLIRLCLLKNFLGERGMIKPIKGKSKY